MKKQSRFVKYALSHTRNVSLHIPLHGTKPGLTISTYKVEIK